MLVLLVKGVWLNLFSVLWLAISFVVFFGGMFAAAPASFAIHDGLGFRSGMVECRIS
jgi:hypothetical protein